MGVLTRWAQMSETGTSDNLGAWWSVTCSRWRRNIRPAHDRGGWFLRSPPGDDRRADALHANRRGETGSELSAGDALDPMGEKTRHSLLQLAGVSTGRRSRSLHRTQSWSSPTTRPSTTTSCSSMQAALSTRAGSTGAMSRQWSGHSFKLHSRHDHPLSSRIVRPVHSS